MCSGWVTRSHYTVDTRFKCRFNIRTEVPGYRIVSSPPVCDKDVVGVTQAVAAGQRAVRKLLFTELPGEGRSVHRALLLPLGGDGATSCAAMRCVFTRHVALTVTACHRAPGARERKYILAIALTTKQRTLISLKIVHPGKDIFTVHEHSTSIKTFPPTNDQWMSTSTLGDLTKYCFSYSIYEKNVRYS